jgi:hypothetical protein
LGSIDGIPCNDEVKQNPLGAVVDVAAVLSALCNDASIVGNDGNYGVESDDEDVVDMDGTTISTVHHHGNQKKRKANTKTGDVEKTYELTGEPTERLPCASWPKS